MHAVPDCDPTLEYRRSLRLDALVGRSGALARMLARLQPALAVPDLQILLTGPSGCGKSLVARLIHENGGRADGPFVEVNCAAIPRELWEAEFFGCSRHAYTGAAERRGRFAAAEGGTLFLDEIGEIPTEHQAKLLRVLDSGCFERLGEDQTRRACARIVAATNRDLEQALEAGTVRPDLYFRLCGYRVAVPALAERPEDIAELAAALTAQESARMGLPPLELAPAAVQELEQRRWPGNVRQLGSAVRQAALEAFAEGVRVVERRHLGPELLPARAAVPAPLLALPTPAEPRPALGPAPASYAQATREFQRALLRDALGRARGNVTHAARALGLSRSHIYKLMHELGLASARPGAGVRALERAG
jgi:Nif-specific regulatory protein